MVILGTEFADDFVITAEGIFGAGLNVRYTTVEVVEVDGLEGDDEFFVLSTAFGVAYRVIGGLGSDVINVTGDVVEDIIVRELEGASGNVNHRATSGDPDYDGLPIDGIDLNVATGHLGNVVITETGGFTSVREGGPVDADRYMVRLASQPTGPVYVTVSATRSPQEEADGSPAGDSLWLCAGTLTDCLAEFEDFVRTLDVDGGTVEVANRAATLTFDDTNWNIDQHIWVFAVDDLRSEGDRVVTVNHSVISGDDRYDATDVRNVEVTLRDNDTPGLYVIEVEPGTSDEDQRTVVVEGDTTTQLLDQLLVQLAVAPTTGIVVVKVELDAESDEAISVTSTDGRWVQATRTITFTAADWDNPVRLNITARDDSRRQDPRVAVIRFDMDAALSDATFGTQEYVFPSLYAPPTRIDIEVWDNESAGVVVLESDGSTLVVMGGATDDEWMRLTKAPAANVDVAVLTDGQVDVVSVGGTPVTPADYSEVGGYAPTRLFLGTVVVSSAGTNTTIARGTGSDLGSFVEDGFAPGHFIRLSLNGSTHDVYIGSVNDQTITLTTNLGVGGSFVNTPISRLIRSGLWEGTITAVTQSTDPGPTNGAWQLDRGSVGDEPGWLADGFLEGQWVRICVDSDGDDSCDAEAQTINVKIDLIRGFNESKDSKLQLTTHLPDAFGGGLVSLPAWLVAGADVIVTRIAPVLVFTPTDYWTLQRIEFAADQAYVGLPGRESVKVFPATTHLLSKLRGPLAVEGGVVGNRALKPGVKLPGETDGPLFNIAAQAPESTQIDVLNIFNDSSQADGFGTLTQTTLSGFGMAKELNFLELDPSLDPSDVLFGESPIVPGGISFGAITAGGVGGSFETNGGESTIEVVNVMLGEGNDKLVIEGTLDPKTPAEVTVAVTITPVADVAGGLLVPVPGVELTRTAGSWLVDGYTVGENVVVTGLPGTWQVVDITHLILVLRPVGGTAVPASASAASVTVQEAGAVQYQGGFVVTDSAIAGRFDVTRPAGTWADDGFEVGQQILISGLSGSWRVITVDGAAMTIAPLTGASMAATRPTSATIQVPGRHGGLTVVHGGGNTRLTVEDASVEVIDAATGAGHDADLRRRDGLAWQGDGFRIGQRVTVNGVLHQIVGFAGTTADCTVTPDAFATCGVGSIMLLEVIAAASLPAGSALVATIAVVDPMQLTISGEMVISVQPAAPTSLPTSTLTCACDFEAAGFRDRPDRVDLRSGRLLDRGRRDRDDAHDPGCGADSDHRQPRRSDLYHRSAHRHRRRPGRRRRRSDGWRYGRARPGGERRVGRTGFAARHLRRHVTGWRSGTPATRPPSTAACSATSRSTRSSTCRSMRTRTTQWVFPVANVYSERRQRRHRRQCAVRRHVPPLACRASA